MLDIKVFMRYNLIDKKEKETMLFVDGLSVYARYLHGGGAIVSDVHFCVGDGQSLAIVGESGSGKSMIVDSLIGTLADNCYATGKIVFDGEDILASPRALSRRLGKSIAFIPQGASESLNPSLKIKTQIYEAFARSGEKLNKHEKKAYALYNLAKVGLKDESVLEKYPFEISGGQAQRVVLAIALCSKPKLIVADEATRGIDAETAEVFLKCVKEEFQDSAKIFVTHDMSLAKTCDKVLVLKAGEQVEYGFSEDVLVHPESEYTQLLLKKAAQE